jgi:hypothetical protein
LILGRSAEKASGVLIAQMRVLCFDTLRWLAYF